MTQANEPRAPGAHPTATRSTLSLSEAPLVLDTVYSRALASAADRATRAGVKRAFRAAYRALRDGDIRPAVLLAARWP